MVGIPQYSALGLQQDVGEARGSRFLKLLTNVQHCALRRRIQGNHRPRVLLCHAIELGDQHAEQHREADPEEDDRDREHPNSVRDERAPFAAVAPHMLVTHVSRRLVRWSCRLHLACDRSLLATLDLFVANLAVDDDPATEFISR
ncbi:Uncharacterised protein [Mycobacteroides abscessus subsp. abscessus]|nr:Uncharacterised protein [Mycobacteroides abscessus subsp. abscessus]